MRQLVIVADMEGASGIFDTNRSWLWNGEDDWRAFGRDCITSDVRAVCHAAVDFGIQDILLYDMHFAGNDEFNIKLEALPQAVRVFDVYKRCFFWRRIRGQAQQCPFGLITVGQHARYGEEDAYFPHTIQSPPIKGFYVNGRSVAEIGSAVLSFDQTPYLANIGCQASMKEALELSPDIVTIPVKDKKKGWEPSPAETYPLIYDQVTAALQRASQARRVEWAPPYEFRMTLCDGFTFDASELWLWKGEFYPDYAVWNAPDMAIGLELFNYVRDRIKQS